MKQNLSLATCPPSLRDRRSLQKCSTMTFELPSRNFHYTLAGLQTESPLRIKAKLRQTDLGVNPQIISPSISSHPANGTSQLIPDVLKWQRLAQRALPGFPTQTSWEHNGVAVPCSLHSNCQSVRSWHSLQSQEDTRCLLFNGLICFLTQGC